MKQRKRVQNFFILLYAIKMPKIVNKKYSHLLFLFGKDVCELDLLPFFTFFTRLEMRYIFLFLKKESIPLGIK